MQVLHDGLYSPCCNSYYDENSETLHDNKLRDLWLRGTHLSKVRTDLLRKDFKGYCRECDAMNLVDTRKIREHLLKLCEERELLPAESIRVVREQEASTVDLTRSDWG